MFKFLKEKLKSTVLKFSKKIEKEVEEKPAKEEEQKKFAEEKKKIIEKKEIKELPEEKKPEKIKEVKEKPKEVEEKQAEEVKQKKGFFRKIKEIAVTKKISEKAFDELFWDMEVALLENNLAVEVIEKIKEDLKENLVNKQIPRGRTSKLILDSLKKTIEELFDIEEIDVVDLAKKKKPFVICFVGINGSGKTTTIAKMVKLFQKNKMSCVLAAADTFRAAAIDQLQEHADKLDVKLIKHDYGSDAAAVAFDAVKHAEAKGIDVVLIDTAGRMQSNVNLMDEMKKIIRVAKPDLKIFVEIIRVAKPDLKIFVGESITGNDAVLQAKKFDETIGIDGIILSKADVDEKGGAAISISYVTKKPILYLGIGQEYKDLQKFDSKIIMKSLEM
jgi:fused signal recognition particle receptor